MKLFKKIYLRPSLVTKLKESFWLASVVLAISVLNICRVIMGTESVMLASKHWDSINPLIAVTFILCGNLLLNLRSILLKSEEKLPDMPQKRMILCFSIGLMISLLALIELNLNLNLMSLNKANIFLGPGPALIHVGEQLSDSNAFNAILMLIAGMGFLTFMMLPKYPRIWQIFPSFGIILTTILSNDFLFETFFKRGNPHFSTISTTTSFMYILTFTGILFLRTQPGMFRPFRFSILDKNILFKRRRLLMIAGFVVLAKLIQMGVQSGLYGAAFGLSIFITVASASFFFSLFAMEFHLANARLRASESFSKRILDVCPGIITIHTPHDNQFIFVSSRTPKILGYSRRRLVGQPDMLSQIIHPDDSDAFILEKQKIRELPDDETYTYRLRWKHLNGSWITLLTTATPFKRNSEGAVLQVLSSSTDITDMEHLKHSLEQANQDLEVERQNLLRSNQDLEIFASVAAHDLKSPLQAIIAWLSVLDHEICEPRSEQVDDSIQNIEHAAKKSVGLINDLLDISRLNHQQNGYIDCDNVDLLKSVIRTLQEDLKKANAEVTIGELPRIRANPVQFETLFSNLIRNAINYRRLDRSLEITVNGHEDGNCCEFSVQDNGSGIHPDHHERIFDLFTRYHSDDEHPGNGMGLAYCRKVVQLMGGRIWVESQVRDGSTIKFIIPKT